MPVHRTTDEWLVELGHAVRGARLAREMDQQTLARLADVSLRSLRNLESGQGSTVSTLIKTVRGLGREDWLDMLNEGTDEPGPVEVLRQLRRAASGPRRAPRRRAS